MTAPLTPTDTRGRPLRDLRISVTDRCNFRCGYCMPRDVFGRDHRFLPKSELLCFEEITRLVQAFIRLGVCKVRLTGGEPLLRGDLEQLVAMLASLDGLDEIAITTNGSLLTAARAVALNAAGIRRINISLDALDEDIYRTINQIPTPLADILAGIDHALAAGFESVKINMVVQKGVNDSEIIPMVRHFRGTPAILRFIEFMDVGNHNHWSLDQVFTAREIIDRIHAAHPLAPLDANYSGEVAKRWRYVDGAGEIGVIASITQPFCQTCSRARLSAVGELYLCLFADSGFDLRALLRKGVDDDELAARLAKVWQGRSDQYSVERESRMRTGEDATDSATPHPTQRKIKVEMSYIGG